MIVAVEGNVDIAALSNFRKLLGMKDSEGKLKKMYAKELPSYCRRRMTIQVDKGGYFRDTTNMHEFEIIFASKVNIILLSDVFFLFFSYCLPIFLLFL